MHDTTRRNVMAVATLGAAAAMTSEATAQGADATKPRGGKQNPRDKYAKPPLQATVPDLAPARRPHGSAPRSWRDKLCGSGRLTGRKALITGGDSGMGRGAAIAFAREGTDVAINYLPEEEPDAREVIDLIRQAGRKAVAIPGDIRTVGFCKSLVDRAVGGLGGLDILVCNAARQQSIPSILDLTDEEFDQTMKTNIYAPFWASARRCRTLSPARRSSAPPPSRRTIPIPTSTLTPRRKRRR